MAAFFRSTARVLRIDDLASEIARDEYLKLHDALSAKLPMVMSGMSQRMVDLETEWRPCELSPSKISSTESWVRSVLEQEVEKRGLTLVWGGTSSHGFWPCRCTGCTNHPPSDSQFHTAAGGEHPCSQGEPSPW